MTTNLERDEAGGGWRWQINLQVITAALTEIEGNPLASEDKFDGPVLFVTGGKSRYVREEDFSVIAAHFPKARRVEIAGAGHNPHMETRGEFVAALFAEPETQGA